MEKKGIVVNKKYYLHNACKLFGCVLFLLYFASCSNNIYFGNWLFEKGPTQNVDIEQWKRLKIGMTKMEVISLLGDSPSKHEFSVDSQERNENTNEYWEYGYKSSLLAGPHPKAYVVFFNREGTVLRIRGPEE